jgi:hypothetical protein
MTWTPPATLCVRKAWLTLGSQTLYLEDHSRGYFCQSLDLGYPTVRAVVDNRPGQHGIDDRTALWGERVVSAQITALVGAGAQIDAIASLFAPFLNVSARPVLHYVLDRPGAAERTLTLRPAALSVPIVGADQRDLHLQWVAADPLPRDPTWHQVQAWSGSGTAAGRAYPLTFNRLYPSGGSGASGGTIVSNGDQPVYPLLYVYGPVTQPQVWWVNSDASGNGQVYFLAGYIIGSGHYVVVDTAAKTAYLDNDPTKPVSASIDWTATFFVPVTPNPNSASLHIAGSSTSPITQVVAYWQDVYLT